MAKFPTQDELTHEQESVCAATQGQRLVVTGPPGTGKTVVAFWRAREILVRRQTVTMVMYNHTLARYVRDWKSTIERQSNVSGHSNFKINTYDSWIWHWLRELASKRDLSVEDLYPSNGQWGFDWNKVLELAEDIFDSGEDVSSWGNLIIDEGQDLPPGFYELLMRMSDHGLVESIMVSADENQTIDNNSSTIRHICECLEVVDSPDGITHHILQKNFRNTGEIHDCASHFYTGGRTGRPTRPDRSGDQPRLYLHTTKGQKDAQLVQSILARPTLTHGVIVAGEREVKRLTTLINDNTNATVQYYLYQGSGPKNKKLADSLDFESPNTVTIMTSKSCKGLEFEATYIHDLESWKTNDLKFQQTMYVATSRAREFLEVHSSNPQAPAISEMPNNMLKIGQ